MIDLEKEVFPIIEQKTPIFKKVRDGVYRMRCVFCGDSQSDPRATHLYLLKNDTGYYCYCHKCNAKRQLDNDVLTMMIGPHSFQLNGPVVHKINPGNPSFLVETDVLGKGDPQYQYLCWRLGCEFTPDELYSFRIIRNPTAFFQKYQISGQVPVPNTIAFVTADGNTICYRNLIEDEEFKWVKQTIYERYESSPYTIRGSVDLLSPDEQHIMMSEGIFDALGVYKHIPLKGNLYMAILGKDYRRGINWLIGKGIFGRNIHIHIYSDQDVPVGKIRSQLRKFRWLYRSISVCYNDADHDFGVPKDRILVRDPILI